MLYLKKIFVLFVCVCCVSLTGWAGQEKRFAQAKRQLEADNKIFWNTIGIVAGISGTAGLADYIIGRIRCHPKTLEEIVARLPAPASSRSTDAKYLLREKKQLQQEAARITRLSSVLEERRAAYWAREKTWSVNPQAVIEGQRISKEIRILEGVLQKRYGVFHQRFIMYKSNYKRFVRRGKIHTVKIGLSSSASTEISPMSKKLLKRAKGTLPLLVLLGWIYWAQASSTEGAMAQRLERHPGLVFSLTQDEEEKIANSRLLTDLYIQIADGVHQIVQMPEEELHSFVELAYQQQQADLVQEQQVQIARQALARQIEETMAY